MTAEPPLRLAADLAGTSPTLIRRIVDKAPPGAVNLGLGQPVIEPAGVLSEAIALAARRPAAYSANAGLPALREAIARHHGCGVSADQILVTVGAEQALFMAICACAEPGDEILVPDPGFPAYELVARWRGLRVCHYPLDPDTNFDLCPEAVLERVRPGRTRLFVFNSPANPTGTVLSEDALRTVLEGLTERGVAWISDEVYGSLAPGPVPRPAQLSPSAGNGITINSLSKSHALMGWRLGWLVGPRDVVAGMIPLQQMTVTCAPVPAQMAALAALSDAGQAAAAELRDEMARRRQTALDALTRIEGLGVPHASRGAIYLFLDVSGWLGGDDVALCEALLDDGVILIPGQAFGARGRGWVRLSYGVDPVALSDGLQRLAAGLERLRDERTTTE